MSESDVHAKKKVPGVLIFIGTITLILVPGAFTAVGWQTLQLKCTRQVYGQPPACEVHNGYLFGLIKTPLRKIDAVESVGFRTSMSSSAGRAGSNVLSTVELSGAGKSVAVFETSSNFNDSEKSEVDRQVRQFLESPQRPLMALSLQFGNIFGWLGLPFFLLVITAVVYSLGWYLLQWIRTFVPSAPRKKDE